MHRAAGSLPLGRLLQNGGPACPQSHGKSRPSNPVSLRKVVSVCTAGVDGIKCAVYLIWLEEAGLGKSDLVGLALKPASTRTIRLVSSTNVAKVVAEFYYLYEVDMIHPPNRLHYSLWQQLQTN